MAARYLIRFDDICPRMNWHVWESVERILLDARVAPLLAVVPDNQDSELNAGPERDDFWRQVRIWQQSGWAIGLHGFQHKYESKSAGIIGRNRYSEFAGLEEGRQQAKVEAALAIFSQHGVTPDAWVAPAHSFDSVTVGLLNRAGLRCISDGYGLWPWLDDANMLWVPQQLGQFYPMPFGVWTVCLHCNGWTEKDLARFDKDLARYRDRITSLSAVRQEFGRRVRSLPDHWFEKSFRFARALRG